MTTALAVLILGATGQVGQALLQQALADKRVSRVTAPTRRPLATHAKLDNPIVDYDKLPPTAPWWRVDVVLCALGTTMKLAGSQAAFYKVDHDYVLAAAKLARAAGTPCFVLNSSTGAKPSAGSFYLRAKAETEHDLAALGFPSLTVVRPSLLSGGKRPDSRPAEALSIGIASLLGPLVPKRLRPISVEKVAAAMLQTGLLGAPGVSMIESDLLQDALTKP
jgi:uncharacterized protein YbjT (DUF2867 family)